LVMYRPKHLPRLTAIRRTLPAPIERVALNVLPHHALKDLLACAQDGFPGEDHRAFSQSADEIEIAAGVVNPSLSPLARALIERGHAHPSKRHARSTGEVLHDDAIVKRAFDVVFAAARFALGRLGSWPGQLPITDPKVQLPELGC